MKRRSFVQPLNVTIHPSKIVVLILALSTLTAINAFSQSGYYKLGRVIGLRYVSLIRGDSDAFERDWKEKSYPVVDSHFPGANVVLMKSDRGTRTSKYAWFWNFDSLHRRNYYYPQNAGPWPNADPLLAKWDEAVGQGDFETDGEGRGDFVLVGTETVREMPWINTLGIHHIEVKDAQGARFDEFITHKWNPNSHLPGWWILVYKVDRAERQNDYILVHAFEPGLLRDIYFPENVTGVSEAVGQAMRPVESLWEELQSYLETPAEGAAEWSDFFIIR